MEEGYREAAHGPTARALGSCLLAACPLVAKAECWCQSFRWTWWKDIPPLLSLLREGTEAAKQGCLTWWLLLRA